MKRIGFVICFMFLLAGSFGCANCTQMSQLRIGMTEVEALQIMDREPDKFSVDVNARYLYWSCRGKMDTSGIKFIDGKVTAFGEENSLRK